MSGVYVDVYRTRREAEVTQDTWGHLAPEAGREYAGTVVYAVGCFGDLAVISVDFADLPDSPWFYEHLHEWIWDQEPEEGRVYRFDGNYRSDRRVQFVGRVQQVEIAQAVTR